MVPFSFKRRPEMEMRAAAEAFEQALSSRRTVRQFSPDAVPREIIESCLRTAASAPSGANLQPWHFGVVGGAEMKRRIRKSAEAEEREFYSRRASDEWKDVLSPLGTDPIKAHLEIAPWLIAVFTVNSYVTTDGERHPTYYPKESVGIATGFLIAALHQAGLVALTHTPSPMNFLNKLLGRPSAEKPFMLLAVGYPADGAKVPRIERKPVGDVVTFFEE